MIYLTADAQRPFPWRRLYADILFAPYGNAGKII